MIRLFAGLLFVAGGVSAQIGGGPLNPGSGGGGGSVTGGSCAAGQYASAVSSQGVPTCAVVPANTAAYTFANFPANPAGTLIVQTDAVAGSDCTAGGGTLSVLCYATGTGSTYTPASKTNNNQLANGAGYVTSAGAKSAAPVQSVATQTGAVTAQQLYAAAVGNYYNVQTLGGMVPNATDAATASANTTALQNAATLVAASGQCLFFPAGTFSYNGWNYSGAPICVEGVAGKTTLSEISTASSAHGLAFGNNNGCGGAITCGSIRNIHFAGPYTNLCSAPKNGQSGIFLNGVTQVSLDNVTIDGFDRGIDGINNDYGLVAKNSRIGFYGNVNVGVNFRGPQAAGGATGSGAGAGNQWAFISDWVGGRYAGYQAGPGSDGLFVGSGGQTGQTSCSGDAPANTGAYVLGRDYDTGTVGSMGIASVLATDHEGVSAYVFNVQGKVNLTAKDSPFLANGNNGTTPTLGFLQTANLQCSNIEMTNNEFSGNWTNPPWALSGDYGCSNFKTSGWYGSNLKFGALNWSANYGVDPQIIQYALTGSAPRGIAEYRDFMNGTATVRYQDGLFTRFNTSTGNREESTNAYLNSLTNSGGTVTNPGTIAWTPLAKVATSGSASDLTTGKLAPAQLATGNPGTQVGYDSNGLQSTGASAPYAAVAGPAKVAPFSVSAQTAAGAGTLGPAAGATSFRYANIANGARIIATGSITQIRTYINSLASATAVYFEVYRLNPAGTFTVVGRSLISSAATGTNTYTLTTPLSARAGDYVGMYVEGNFTSTVNTFSSSTTYNTTAYPSYSLNNQGQTSVVDFVGATTSSAAGTLGNQNPIEVYEATGPVIAWMTDSKGAGTPFSSSYLQASYSSGAYVFPIPPVYSFTTNFTASPNLTSLIDDSNQPCTYVTRALGYPCAVFSIPGATSTGNLNTVLPAVLAAKPAIVVINTSVNNATTGVSTATTQSDYQSIINQLVAAGIKVIDIGTEPATSLTDAQWATSQTNMQNAQAACAAAAAPGCVWGYPAVSTAAGQYRPTGPAGNLYNAIPAFLAADNLHWINAGAQAVGLATANVIEPPSALGLTVAVPSPLGGVRVRSTVAAADGSLGWRWQDTRDYLQVSPEGLDNNPRVPGTGQPGQQYIGCVVFSVGKGYVRCDGQMTWSMQAGTLMLPTLAATNVNGTTVTGTTVNATTLNATVGGSPTLTASGTALGVGTTAPNTFNAVTIPNGSVVQAQATGGLTPWIGVVQNGTASTATPDIFVVNMAAPANSRNWNFALDNTGTFKLQQGSDNYGAIVTPFSCTPLGTGGCTFLTRTTTPQVVVSGGTPTIAVNTTGAGASGTATLVTGSTNLVGAFTVTPSAAAASSTLATITFSAAVASAPRVCLLQPQNSAAAANYTTVYTSVPTTTGFNLNSGATASANVAMTFGYTCF